MKIIVLIVATLLISTNIYAAKIYKCKDASGKVEFSNSRCKSADSGGLVAIDAPMKPSYDDRRHYAPSVNGETDAVRQLRLMQESSRRDSLKRESEKSARRSDEAHDAYMAAKKQRAKDSAERKEANCNYNKAKSKYWKKKARSSGSSRDLYKSLHERYESQSGGC